MKNYCIDCTDKVEDEIGLFCDLACGKHTAYVNYQEGIKEVVEWIEEDGIWAQVPFAVSETEETMWCIYPEEWIAKLKEWGVNNG